jgi:hypothetical protein
VNIAAVLSGVIAGHLTTLIIEFLMGPGVTTIGSALVSAAVVASVMTKANK